MGGSQSAMRQIKQLLEDEDALRGTQSSWDVEPVLPTCWDRSFGVYRVERLDDNNSAPHLGAPMWEGLEPPQQTAWRGAGPRSAVR